MYPRPIQRLVELFSDFPTIGPRTAGRMVFYLLKQQEEQFEDLLKALKDLKEQVKLCAFCFNPFVAPAPQGLRPLYKKDEGTDAERSEAEVYRETLCTICSDPARDKTLLCVVEKEEDLATLEQTKTYKGLYFILGGTVGSLRQEDLKSLRTEELKARIENPEYAFTEIILALNPTTEGEATTLYLQRFLEPLKIKTTRLGKGLPIGGEVEYADEETLRNALEGRR